LSGRFFREERHVKIVVCFIGMIMRSSNMSVPGSLIDRQSFKNCLRTTGFLVLNTVVFTKTSKPTLFLVLYVFISACGLWTKKIMSKQYFYQGLGRLTVLEMSSYVSSYFHSSDAVRLTSYNVSYNFSFNYSRLKLLSFVCFSFCIINNR
jgi:hypothetical protein